MRKVEEIFQQAATIYNERELDEVNLSSVGLILIGLGDLKREWNELAEAEQLLTRGIEQIKKMGSVEFLVEGYITLARVKQAQGDLTGSLQTLQKAGVIVRKHQSTRMFAVVETYFARFYLTIGETLLGINWVENRDLKMDEDDIPLNELQQVMFARILSLQGKTEEALQILDRLFAETKQAGRNGSLIEILLVRSLVFYSQKRWQEAFADLEYALQLAEPEGYVRVFADEGELMGALLNEYLHKGRADGSVRGSLTYVNMLMEAAGFVTPEDFSYPAAQLKPVEGDKEVSILTNREVDIYRLLEAGYTNQAIASMLVISENTVRTHRKSIYSKLGVNNRAQMIRKAREIKLL